MIRQKNGGENSRKKRKEGRGEVNERRGKSFFKDTKKSLLVFLIIYVI